MTAALALDSNFAGRTRRTQDIGTLFIGSTLASTRRIHRLRRLVDTMGSSPRPRQQLRREDTPNTGYWHTLHWKHPRFRPTIHRLRRLVDTMGSSPRPRQRLRREDTPNTGCWHTLHWRHPRFHLTIHRLRRLVDTMGSSPRPRQQLRREDTPNTGYWHTLIGSTLASTRRFTVFVGWSTRWAAALALDSDFAGRTRRTQDVGTLFIGSTLASTRRFTVFVRWSTRWAAALALDSDFAGRTGRTQDIGTLLVRAVAIFNSPTSFCTVFTGLYGRFVLRLRAGEGASTRHPVAPKLRIPIKSKLSIFTFISSSPTCRRLINITHQLNWPSLP